MSKPLENRYEAMCFIECIHGNPNGDPDLGNMPRVDGETQQGYMTDVCQHRRIRDYIADTYEGADGMEICMQRNSHLGRIQAQICEEAGVDPAKKKARPKPEIRKTLEVACRRFYDIRCFGAVLTSGPNCGAIEGPVRFAHATSLTPVQPYDITITRDLTSKLKGGEDEKCVTLADYEELEASVSADKLRTMGTKQFIPYGLYEQHIFASARYAQRTGFSEEDLMTLFHATLEAYDAGLGKSKGEMWVPSPLIIFKHVGYPGQSEDARRSTAKNGCAQAQRLFGLVNCELKPDVEYPRSYRDYICTIDLSHVPFGVEVGFLQPFTQDIVWGKLPDSEDWIVAK